MSEPLRCENFQHDTYPIRLAPRYQGMLVWIHHLLQVVPGNVNRTKEAELVRLVESIQNLVNQEGDTNTLLLRKQQQRRKDRSRGYRWCMGRLSNKWRRTSSKRPRKITECCRARCSGPGTYLEVLAVWIHPHGLACPKAEEIAWWSEKMSW